MCVQEILLPKGEGTGQRENQYWGQFVMFASRLFHEIESWLEMLGQKTKVREKANPTIYFQASKGT